ncbi:MAG: Rrf2 family transcriptional regulator [Prolixibacteraceae bacterium]|nr:Rrf2 family transcriptional regulator [Prolixibacteraceae bacterium]
MLSNTCKYALRALIYLSKYPADGRIGIKQISEDLKISSAFLGKILQGLTRQKLLISSKGPNGGFALAKKPEKISLWNVVVIVDGEDYFTNCLVGMKPCKTHDTSKLLCPVHFKYNKLREKIITFYKNTSLKNVSEDITRFEELMEL